MRPEYVAVLNFLNGVLFILMILIVVSAASYVAKTYYSAVFLEREYGPVTARDALQQTYSRAKAGISQMILSIGIACQIGTLWTWQAFRLSGREAQHFWDVGIFTMIFGTAIAVVGGLCWIRVVTPVKLPPRTWLVTAVLIVSASATITLLLRS